MQTLSLPRPGAVDEDKATTKALDSVALAVARSKRTVLLVGAGISTNAGIPDFRSPGSGLYSPPSESSSASPRPASTFVTPPSTLKGPALFSASVYSSPDTTAEHLRFVAAFKRSLDTITRNSSSPPSSPRTVQRPVTPTHDFMRLLKKRNKLLRVYTQNIDGLEGVGTGLAPVALAGITPCASSAPGLPAKAKGKGKAKVEGDYVQLHGAVHAVRCTGCDFVRAWSDEDGEAFAGGSVGACPQCEERASIRLARGQRTLSSLSRAFLRPSITLYNESPPASSASTIGSLSLSDLSASPGPDVMLVMGTSLRIPGFKKLVKEFARSVKSRGGVRVLVNREEIGSKSEWRDVFDYQVLGDTDAFVTRLTGDWKRLRPQDWTGTQATLGPLFASSKAAVTAAPTKKKPPPSPRKAPPSPHKAPPSPRKTPPLPRKTPPSPRKAPLAPQQPPPPPHKAPPSPRKPLFSLCLNSPSRPPAPALAPAPKVAPPPVIAPAPAPAPAKKRLPAPPSPAPPSVDANLSAEHPAHDAQLAPRCGGLDVPGLFAAAAVAPEPVCERAGVAIEGGREPGVDREGVCAAPAEGEGTIAGAERGEG
ncbi:DHS-like NAD/FAD-binding domain-containing protein [Rhodotorula diobovata]|uniref:DHS-like NAD/FAD-binding domain-containing protein n=1 Tax=Rhodotorula diobovata TaxID=5288 RepID=A0A5C5G3H5_9BASI|nr:DHS-like NAD/FAD-binding domain-containing protein [Rhodotorula diobovata]